MKLRIPSLLGTDRAQHSIRILATQRTRQLNRPRPERLAVLVPPRILHSSIQPHRPRSALPVLAARTRDELVLPPPRHVRRPLRRARAHEPELARRDAVQIQAPGLPLVLGVLQHALPHAGHVRPHALPAAARLRVPQVPLAVAAQREGRERPLLVAARSAHRVAVRRAERQPAARGRDAQLVEGLPRRVRHQAEGAGRRGRRVARFEGVGDGVRGVGERGGEGEGGEEGGGEDGFEEEHGCGALERVC